MERRTKLLILIVVALLLLALGIWYLLQPFIQNAQPPALPSQVTPSTALPPPKTPAATVPTTPAAPLALDVKHLQDLAGTVVARIGSGSNDTGFQGYNDVLLYATPSEQTALKKEQAALVLAHPAAGPIYGIVTRVVAIDSRSAVSGAATLPFVVQVQKAEDAGNPGAPTLVTYKQVTVTFEKQADGKTYLIGSIVWKDYQP